MTLTEFYAADAFDLDLVCSHLDEVDRDALERMRHLMWAVLAPNTKRRLKPEDVVQFSWEKVPAKDEKSVPTTKEMFENAFKNFKIN